MWRNVKDSLMAASASLPKRKKEAKNEWMTDGILELMKQRKQQKNMNGIQYQILEKEIRKKYKQAKEQWCNNQCEEIEKLRKSHRITKCTQK